jgi:hypothetical protein
MSASASWQVQVVSVGRSLIAGPEVFWMSRWGETLPLAFNVVIARSGDIVALINTSPPDSTEAIEAEFPAMRYLHDAPRGDLVRSAEERMEGALARVGLRPDDVTHVLLTPLELYTTGTLRLFRSATIAISRRGWVHFHTTHEHPHDSRWRSFDRETLVDLVSRGTASGSWTTRTNWRRVYGPGGLVLITASQSWWRSTRRSARSRCPTPTSTPRMSRQ